MSVQVKWRGDTRYNIDSNLENLSAKEIVVDTDNWILGLYDGSVMHYLPQAPLILTGAGPFVLTNSFLDVRIYADTSGGPVSVALPVPVAPVSPSTVSDSRGLQVWVKDIADNAATNNITISPSSGLTINGSSSYVIATNNGRAIVEFTGSNWNA